ncbi:MAG: hypothetical protein L0Z62_17860 [Gemmataceae bacterium]|nr:hypothetical protein [Gemmataceae bacterium]
MKANLSKVAVGLAVLMTGALFPQFARAQCDFHNLVPDGRFSPTFSISSGTNDIAFFFMGVAGRSYSVEARVVSRSYNDVSAASLSANWGAAGADCPITNISGLQITNTIEPSTQPTGSRFFRASFTAPSTAFYEMRVGNTSATLVSIAASASDTTLFNPLWTTAGAFETFYKFQNTTNATCNVTLRMIDTAGVERVNTTLAPITAGSGSPTRNTGAGDLAVPDNLSGVATMTHDCPPGAIQGDAFAGVFGTTTAVLPLKIVAAREAAH